MSGATQHPGHVKPETIFGFWVYIMTDCMIFASLFAVFAVQRTQYAGGPSGRDLFDLNSTLLETLLLLLSSASCGFAMIGVHRRRKNQVLGWLAVTFCLGAGFIFMEISEFMKMVAENAGAGRSAFLSAFFTLVGTHGLHVTAGLGWLLVLAGELVFARKSVTDQLANRLLAFSLFWHFLDIIWICVFTFVYLNGFL
jgi:cytochrome o ubiquinol oxidase subunit 3